RCSSTPRAAPPSPQRSRSTTPAPRWSSSSTTDESTMDLDAHLLLIQAGDADAFGRWLAGAEGTIRLSLRSFAASVDTEAVLQEALLRVWQVAPRAVPDGRPNVLLRLGIRIARNLAISERRRLHTVTATDETLEAALDDVAPNAPHPPDPHL